MPLAGHAEALAAAFGVRFQNGFAMDANRRGERSRSPDPRARWRPALLRTVAMAASSGLGRPFTGQAFRIDPKVNAEPLLVLPEGYRLLLPAVAFKFSNTPRIPAAYLLQGAIVRHGNGRAAFFGEAAMFSAARRGPQAAHGDERTRGRVRIRVCAEPQPRS